MTFGNALLYSVLGMAVVFFALVFLMVIIKVMTALGPKEEGSASGASKRSGGAAASASNQAGASSVASGGTAAGNSSTGNSAAGNSAAGSSAPKNTAPAPGTAGDIKLYNTPPRIAAMLMAIVADEMKVPLNELRFISIKEIGENK